MYKKPLDFCNPFTIKLPMLRDCQLSLFFLHHSNNSKILHYNINKCGDMHTINYSL